MRHIKHDQAETFVLPVPDFEDVVLRDLGEHARSACAGSACFGVFGGEFELRHILKIDTTVGRAGIEDELALDAVDGRIDQQMVGLAYGEAYFLVFFLLKDFRQVCHLILLAAKSRANYPKLSFLCNCL